MEKVVYPTAACLHANLQAKPRPIGRSTQRVGSHCCPLAERLRLLIPVSYLDAGKNVQGWVADDPTRGNARPFRSSPPARCVHKYIKSENRKGTRTEED